MHEDLITVIMTHTSRDFCDYLNDLVLGQGVWANNTDPDQTASKGTV